MTDAAKSEFAADGTMPLWICVHEAGHAIARLQLHAAEAWFDNDGKFVRYCEITEPSFDRVYVESEMMRGRYVARGALINLGDYQTYWRQEAIVAAAGPVAEIRYRERSSMAIWKRKAMQGERSDWARIEQAEQLGAITRPEAVAVAKDIAECWPQIMLLAESLQIVNSLSFAQVSTILRLADGGMSPIFDQSP